MFSVGNIQGKGPGPHKTVRDLKAVINEMVKDELAKLKGDKLNPKEIVKADLLAGALSSSKTLKELKIV
jgi:hypothetical protein